MHSLHRDPSHFSPYDEGPSFSPSFVTVGGFEYVEISPAKYISAQEFSELQERERTSRLSASSPPSIVSPVLSNDQPVQFHMEPFSEFTPRVNELNAHVDRLGQGFYNVERTFDFIQDPYDNTNHGYFSFYMLLMESWVTELNPDKDIWKHFSEMRSLVIEAIQIHMDA